jgi:hypothetical protein
VEGVDTNAQVERVLATNFGNVLNFVKKRQSKYQPVWCACVGLRDACMDRTDVMPLKKTENSTDKTTCLFKLKHTLLQEMRAASRASDERFSFSSEMR